MGRRNRLPRGYRTGRVPGRRRTQPLRNSQPRPQISLRAPHREFPMLESIVLFDTNCFLDRMNGRCFVDEDRLGSLLLQDPNAYMPDSVLGELVSKDRDVMARYYQSSSLRDKVIGKIDPRLTGKKEMKILDIINIRYGRNPDYEKIRSDLVGAYKRVEDGRFNILVDHQRGAISEQDYLSKKSLFDNEKDDMLFRYLVNTAMDVARYVHKRDGSQSHNIIYDAYTCALTHYVSMKSGRQVELVAMDGDVLGRNGIYERMKDKLSDRLSRRDYKSPVEEKLLKELTDNKIKEVRTVELRHYLAA
jgi:hypothetical protein